MEIPDGNGSLTLTASLKKLFLETSASTGAKDVVNPEALLKSVCARWASYIKNEQQDSHELLGVLLAGLHEEETSKEPKFVDTMFGGQIISSVSCLKCGHTSTSDDYYRDLSLPIPTEVSAAGTSGDTLLMDYLEQTMVSSDRENVVNENEVVSGPTVGPFSNENRNNESDSDSRLSVEKCLSEFTTFEILEDRNCDQCLTTSKSNASKRILITRVPPILIIQLKRLTLDAKGNSIKFGGHVGFSNIIDLEPYMDPRYDTFLCDYCVSP